MLVLTQNYCRIFKSALSVRNISVALLSLFGRSRLMDSVQLYRLYVVHDVKKPRNLF